MRAPLLALAVLLAGCAAPGPGPGQPPAGSASAIAVEAPMPIAAHEFRDREADAAIDPRDARHAVVFYNERPEPYKTGAIFTDPITPGIVREALAATRDGGASWQRSVLPHATQAPPGSRWSLYCAMGDPNVVFDREGVVHVVTLFIECGGPLLGSSNGILHATTGDDGATWSEPDLAWVGAAGFAGVFQDREWTAYDPASGALGIAWTSFQGAGQRAVLSAIFSTDGGRAWSTPEELFEVGVLDPGLNFLVHATWAADGKFHITTFGCPEGTKVDGSAGRCLWHFAGRPGGPWERSELPLAGCPGAPADGVFDYAASAADFEGQRLFAASAVFQGTEAQGVCVFASADHGATWPVASFLPAADHPWLALAPDGSAALAYLALNGTQATPTLALLAPGTLQLRALEPLGPGYDADTDDDGALEYGDYDALAAGGGRFVWALTQPNQEGRKHGDPWNDLDVWGYRGSFG